MNRPSEPATLRPAAPLMEPVRRRAILMCEGTCKKPTPHVPKEKILSPHDPHVMFHFFACLPCGHVRKWGAEHIG